MESLTSAHKPAVQRRHKTPARDLLAHGAVLTRCAAWAGMAGLGLGFLVLFDGIVPGLALSCHHATLIAGTITWASAVAQALLPLAYSLEIQKPLPPLSATAVE